MSMIRTNRCSFTIALQSARDQVIQAAGVTSDDTTPAAGVIARAILAGLLPGPPPADEHLEGQITRLPLQRTTR
ncbi:hypothetical protein [Nonomuraea fuscirosea]|uniref:hypothetical protein n=1 Tax=Nonomuraea fuscirosea TaxID=1291556 RepID=UPI00343D6C5D